jgi:Fic family protein
MNTLKYFSTGISSIPAVAAWYLADISESRGKQDLFVRQAPQKLRALREHALIESAVSSNRIEGIEIEKRRVGTVIFGKPPLRDRNEEEIRGYRDALRNIHEKPDDLTISMKTVLDLHRLCRSGTGDAGELKEKKGDIIEKYSDGRVRIRFKTVTPKQTKPYMEKLIKLYSQCLEEETIHPLIILAAFNLDFLCIHPFRDGNGRVSRLLFLLQCYHHGYDVGRYISIERLIEENKERYYETLEQSSVGWHEGKHDPWPYINYLLFILKSVYKDFETQLGKIKSPRGAKTQMIEAAIDTFGSSFTLSQIESACPGVSRDMIRRTLRNLQKKGDVECLGRGPGAEWCKRGNTLKKGQ